MQEDLEAAIDGFVGHYNHYRYHESLKNFTLADVYFGRGQTILLELQKIKGRTGDTGGKLDPPANPARVILMNTLLRPVVRN